jgi:protein transport protein SEC24
MEYADNQAAAAAAAAAAQQKKKRAYAAQAYEFGGNAQGQQQQPPPPAQPAYGAAPGYGQPMSTPQMPAAPQMPAGDQLASQFGQMNIQSQQPAAPQPMQHQPPTHMNQLFPSDLISQPFQVSELDLPPPPINLPPNTSVTPSPYANCQPKFVRSTLNTVPTTHSLLKKSRLPFALVISPYTSLHDNEDPVSSNLLLLNHHPANRKAFTGSGLHRSSHLSMPALPILHQSICDFSRPWA